MSGTKTRSPTPLYYPLIVSMILAVGRALTVFAADVDASMTNVADVNPAIQKEQLAGNQLAGLAGAQAGDGPQPVS